MRVFEGRVCAQGDVLFVRLDNTPDVSELKPMDVKNGRLVVTHSETGHDHVMVAERAKGYELPDSLRALLVVGEGGATLEHTRSYDTHESIMFPPGAYEVRRQREHAPEGFRRVAD